MRSETSQSAKSPDRAIRGSNVEMAHGAENTKRPGESFWQRMPPGRALIAAAADEKMALEGEGGHGVFTHTVLRALAGEANSNRDGFVDVSELAAYVDQQLPEITKRKWNYEQFPVLETRGSSFPVTVGPNR